MFKRGDWVVWKTLKSVPDPSARFGRSAVHDGGWTYPFKVVGTKEICGNPYVDLDMGDDLRTDETYPLGFRGMRLATKEDFNDLIESLKSEVSNAQKKLRDMEEAQASTKGEFCGAV